MLKDYLAGWLDAVGTIFAARKGNKFYPVFRVTSTSEVVPRLFEQEYGGAVRISAGRWIWEAARRDVVEKVAREMRELSLLKGGQAEMILRLLSQTGNDAALTASKIKDLNEVSSQEVQ